MYTDKPHPMIANHSRPHPDTRRAHQLGRALLLGCALAGLVSGLVGCTSTKPEMTGVDANRADRVVVKKSQRKLELLNNGRVIREYRIALGGSPDGHKYREGDQRTPIGDYQLNWRNANSNFYKSIHISYPSERDKLVSRSMGYSNPGGMIMIHGLPNYIQSEDLRKQYASRDWTQGCIAVQNHEMDEIWQMVRDGTPIRILP